MCRTQHLTAALKRVGLGLFLVLVLLAPILYTRVGAGTRVYAAASNNLNFQARLLTGTGAIVPDGNYSIQFNLYNVATAGTTQWTETQGTVPVRAGYVSVYLGSVTPFPSTIDWSQQQWLTMNVNGDGEMTPRLKLTAVPNALHANEADALRSGANLLTADNLAQLAPLSPQVINSALAALRLNQTGAGLLAQLQHNGADVLTIANNGDLTSSGSATFSGGALTLGTVTQQGGLVLQDGAGKTGTIKTSTLGANRNYTFPDADGTVCLTTTCGGAANAFINGGNLFGSAAALGTNDNFALNLRTNNTNQLTLDTSGNLNFLNGGLQVGGTTVLTSGRVLQNVTADTSILSSGTLGVNRGGTGLNSYTTGDLLFASGSTALSSLSDVVSGNVLLSGGVGTSPSWGKVTLGTHTTGSYVANLGTLTGLSVTGNSGAGSTPALSVVYGSGSNTAAQGNTALSFTGSGNLTGSVSGTAGGGFTTNTLNVVSNPSFSGLVTGSANTTGLALTGTPTNSATSSLIQIGSAIAGGNAVANGGTYLGLNAPNTGAGSSADFLNFQVNNVSKLKVDNTGLIDSAGGLAIGGTTVLTSGRVLQNVTLDAGVVTSGILPVNRGGTGLNGSSAANGQLLIGNGTGFALAALANNGGLTITNTAGGIGLAVNYGSTSTSAVRGDTTLICPSGTGNLNGAGNTITLGTGGTCSALDTKAAVTFATSVTTPIVTNAGALTLSTTGLNDLTLTSGSGLLVLNASTLRRTAAGTTTFDLVDGSNTTLAFTNSGTGNLNLSADGTITAGAGLTVTSGGASITGNTSVASGTFTSSGGLISLNDASTFGTKINTGTSSGTITIGGGSSPLVIDSTAFDVSATGALSGITTLVTSSTINTNTFTGTNLTFGGASGAISTTGSGNLTIGPAGSGVLALNTGSGGTLTTNAGTIQRSGTTGLSLDLANTSTTTLTVTNSDASNVANLSVEGGITAGTNSAFSVNTDGDVTGVARQLDGSSTANGASAGGLGSSTSLTLVSAANFDVGNYVRVTSANCGGTGINPCYAKITAKSTNTLTIAPALTWANSAAVVEFHFPEIGGLDTAQTLANRYGRGYFISGVATGNGTTFYNEDSVTSSLANFDFLSGVTGTLSIGVGANKITLGGSSTTTTFAGNVSFTGTVSGIGPSTGTSGYLQRNGTTISPATAGDSFTTSGNISTIALGTITAAAGLTVQGGGAAITGNSNVTGTLGVSNTLTVSAGGASVTGGLTLATGALNLTSGGITSVGSIAGATTLSLSGAITGATSTNTINGLVINGGALSSITTINASGAITAAITTNTINGLIINSGAVSGATTINASGLITSAGLTAGSGLVQGTGGLTFTGPISLNVNASTSTTNIGTGTTSGQITIGGGSTLLVINTPNLGFDGTNGLSVVGKASFSTRTYVPGTSGTIGQGYFIGPSAAPLSAFQALDLGGNTYSFFATNKNYNGTTWADNGLARTGSSFQIQNDAFTFYSFDTGTNFTPRFTVASGGNVGIGLSGAPAGLLSVGGTTGTFQVSSTGLATIGGGAIITGGPTLIQRTATGASVIIDRTDGVIGALKSGSAKVAFFYDNTGSFSISSDTRANIASGTGAGTDVLTALASGNVGIGDTNPLALFSVGSTSQFQVNGTGGITGVGFNNGSGGITNSGSITGVGTNISGTGALTLASGGTSDLILDSASNKIVIAGTDSIIQRNSTGTTTFDLNDAGTTTLTIDNLGAGVANLNVVSGVYQVGGTSGLTIAACTAGQYLGNAVATKGGIITAGSCRNDATGLSDVRLKTDITSVGSVLDKLDQVRVVTFDFRVDEFPDLNLDHGLQYGVIAQELEQIFPELVSTRDDGYKEVNFKGLSFYTLKAVTELAAKVDALGGGSSTNGLSTGGTLRLTNEGVLQNITGLSMVSGGASIAGGINNNGGGINNIGAVLGATTISGQGLVLNANTSDNLLTLSKDNKGVFTVFNNGALGLQTDATNAFGVKNAAGTAIFTIDTQNGKVVIGSGDNAKTVLFTLDSRSTVDDPAGVNGASYYNAAAGRFRCYQDNRWQDCLPAGDLTNSIAADKVNWLQPSDDQEFPGTPRVVTSLNRAHEFRLSMRLTAAAAANATCRLQYANGDNGPWNDLAASGGSLAIDQIGTLKSDWVKITDGAKVKDDTVIRVMCQGGDSTQTVTFYGVAIQLR